MLTQNQIDQIRKICGKDWEFNVYPDDDSVTADLKYLGIDYDSTQEFSPEDTADLHAFAEAVEDIYENFDPEEETYLWLGPDGHGTNGAPRSMRVILEQMDDLDDAWKNLASKLTALDEGHPCDQDCDDPEDDFEALRGRMLFGLPHKTAVVDGRVVDYGVDLFATELDGK